MKCTGDKVAGLDSLRPVMDTAVPARWEKDSELEGWDKHPLSMFTQGFDCCALLPALEDTAPVQAPN